MKEQTNNNEKPKYVGRGGWRTGRFVGFIQTSRPADKPGCP